VSEMTGCRSMEYIRLVLKHNRYDVDDTAETLMQEKYAGGDVNWVDCVAEEVKEEIKRYKEKPSTKPLGPNKKSKDRLLERVEAKHKCIVQLCSGFTLIEENFQKLTRS